MPSCSIRRRAAEPGGATLERGGSGQLAGTPSTFNTLLRSSAIVRSCSSNRTFTERRFSRKARTSRSSQSGQGESSPWRIRNHLPGRVTRPLGKQYQQPPQDRCVLVPSRGEPVSHGGLHLHVPDLGVEAKLMADHHVPADCGVTRCREPVVTASHLTWRAIALVVLLGTLLLVSPQGLPSSIKDGVSYSALSQKTHR